MVKVTLPVRTINTMGSVSVPAIDFDTGDNWETIEGSLVIYDTEGIGIAQFATGHWSYVVSVD